MSVGISLGLPDLSMQRKQAIAVLASPGKGGRSKCHLTPQARIIIHFIRASAIIRAEIFSFRDYPSVVGRNQFTGWPWCRGRRKAACRPSPCPYFSPSFLPIFLSLSPLPRPQLQSSKVFDLTRPATALSRHLFSLLIQSFACPTFPPPHYKTSNRQWRLPHRPVGRTQPCLLRMVRRSQVL